MKTIQISILFLLSPITFFAQTLTGLWMGTVSNDSTTIRTDRSFEIVLTQYKDKVYGYSRSTFIVNDTLYYIVKRVTGAIENDICEVKDDDIVSHNFPRKPEKGVKMISTFRRNQSDGNWHLDGDWKTTESKKHRYYSISGKINLKTEPDLEKSRILPHLEELKLADDVAFYKESKKKTETVAATTLPPTDNKILQLAKIESTSIPVNDIKKDSVILVQVKPNTIATTPNVAKETQKENLLIADKFPINTINETKKEEVSKTQVRSEPITAKQSPVNNPLTETKTIGKNPDPSITAVKVSNKDSIRSALPGSEPVAVMKQPIKPIVKAPIAKEDKQVVGPSKEIIKEEKTVSIKPDTRVADPALAVKTIVQEKKDVDKENDQGVKTTVEAKRPTSQAATLAAERRLAPPQTVLFQSDSLELSLYDNGEIDGDTVSVLLNGEIILAKQGLKASAIKKTIYITPGSNDSLTLVLYAENLGKYPPNTGLLVVHDGEEVYQIRFSADLQQNAAIIFKRKRK